MTTGDLIDYYTHLLIAQYASLAKATGTIAAVVGAALQNQVVRAVGDGLDVKTAAGAQLDLLGSYRGVSRQIYGASLPNTYFRMGETGTMGPYNGFGRTGQPAPAWRWLRTGDAYATLLYTLTDEDMRTVIEFMADKDACDHGLGTVDALLQKYFGVYAGVLDNQNMTIIYVDRLDDPGQVFRILAVAGFLPRPSGVGYLYFKSGTLGQFFGMQRSGAAVNSTFVGFSRTGAYKTGAFLRNFN